MHPEKSSLLTLAGIEMEVERKNIRHVYLRVTPPGHVRVAAPLRCPDEAILHFVQSKISWIEKTRQRVRRQKWEPRKEFIEGETHHFLGKSYFLTVTETKGRPRVELRERSIDLSIHTRSSRRAREKIMDAWYRTELEHLLPGLIDKWERIVQVKISDWQIRKMKTRWGTCHPRDKRITINLELAKRPLHCLEYLLCHELVHLLEKHHNARFKNFMSMFLPEWRQFQKELRGGSLRSL